MAEQSYALFVGVDNLIVISSLFVAKAAEEVVGCGADAVIACFRIVFAFEILEAVTDFIDYYNNKRPRASNGGLSPVQFRHQNPNGTYLMSIDSKGS